MVSDIIVCSWPLRSGERSQSPLIGMSPDMISATEDMRRFLFDRVYNVQSAKKEAGKARRALRGLYGYLCQPTDFAEAGLGGEPNERSVVDYIAGMTDQFAQRLAGRLSRRKNKG
jgi:dGTPase